MRRFCKIFTTFIIMILISSNPSFSSSIIIPEEVLNLIEGQKEKGPLQSFQSSIPLGGTKQRILRTAFYAEGTKTGSIQYASFAPEEKEFDVESGIHKVVGRNLYTIGFNRAPFALEPTPPASLSKEDKTRLQWEAICAQLGLDPTTPLPQKLYDSDDDGSADFTD